MEDTSISLTTSFYREIWRLASPQVKYCVMSTLVQTIVQYKSNSKSQKPRKRNSEKKWDQEIHSRSDCVWHLPAVFIAEIQSYWYGHRRTKQFLGASEVACRWWCGCTQTRVKGDKMQRNDENGGDIDWQEAWNQRPSRTHCKRTKTDAKFYR